MAAELVIKAKPALNKEQLDFKNLLIENGFNDVHAHLIAQRNVKDLDEARYVYTPAKPNALKGIQEFAEKLAKHIVNGSKISVIADYDCDGATSCAIAVKGLEILKAKNVNFFVPNRFKHGYGISKSVVDDLIETYGKPDVIITVDNGIAAHEGVDYTKSLGIDILITDHHLPIKDKENPKADALVNPNQVGDESGLGNMAGCGVIFYCLIQTGFELVKLNWISETERKYLNSLLDLVSLGTVADVVKLDKNNRMLVKHGLTLVRNNKSREGVKSLFLVSGKQPSLATSTDYGFSIAPRINAAGRLEDMTIGIKCLLSNEKAESDILASQLNDLNLQRKSIEQEMKSVALEKLEEKFKNSTEIKVANVIFDEDYHEGVIGIVASRVKELTNSPTIVFSPTEDEEFIKGSGRSIPEVHLRDTLDTVYKTDPSIFVNFGGHAMAAGLTIKRDKLNEFEKNFNKAVKEIIGDKPLDKIIEFDLKISPSQLSLELGKLLENEIFGQGFPAPIFSTEIKVKEISYINSRETGEPVHTKYLFEDDLGFSFEGLQFFTVDDNCYENVKVNLIFSLSISRFRGDEKISLLIHSIKPI